MYSPGGHFITQSNEDVQYGTKFILQIIATHNEGITFKKTKKQ